MHRQHCNRERETRQSFKEECSCKQQLACSDVLCIHTMCARKDINRAVVVVAGKYFRNSFAFFFVCSMNSLWHPSLNHIPLLVPIGLEPCPVKISSLNTDDVQVNPNIGQIFSISPSPLCVFSYLLLVNKDEARDPDSSDPSSKKDANKPNTAVEFREPHWQ